MGIKYNVEHYKLFTRFINYVVKDWRQVTDSNGRIKVVSSLTMGKIAQRQKLIKMADASEFGWQVLHEYVTNPLASNSENPLASNSEDVKRIYKAEARSMQKYKAEKTKNIQADLSLT